jgi:hypothetical protein
MSKKKHCSSAFFDCESRGENILKGNQGVSPKQQPQRLSISSFSVSWTNFLVFVQFILILFSEI